MGIGKEKEKGRGKEKTREYSRQEGKKKMGGLTFEKTPVIYVSEEAVPLMGMAGVLGAVSLRLIQTHQSLVEVLLYWKKNFRCSGFW